MIMEMFALWVKVAPSSESFLYTLCASVYSSLYGYRRVFRSPSNMASQISFFAVLLLFCATGLGRAEETASLTKKSLVESINKFGCSLLCGLYSNLGPQDNMLVSPVNAYTALALLHLGATGETRQQLSAVMKMPETVTKNYTEVHEQLHAILSHISPPQSSAEPYGRFHETKLANGIFLQKDFPIKPTYVESAKKYYDSLVQNLDFMGQSQAATDSINKWISESTKGRIDKFFGQPLSGDTVAVLVSALYFNAEWRSPFFPKDTKLEKFNTGTTEIEVPMMNKVNYLMEHSSDESLHYDSVTLLYSGKEHEMKIYLLHSDHGDHGSLAHLLHSLAEQNFAPNTTVSTYRRVNLKLPKMKFSWKDSVVNALKLQTTFSNPHLDELTPSKNVKISDMIHATELEVDEKGTIASATTAIEMSLMSALITPEEEPVNFYVNRSFLVTINHKMTGAILFAGIVRKPTK